MGTNIREAKGRKTFVIVGVAMVAVGLAIAFVYGLVASGLTRGPDAMFGDQHLKTTVALIELHRVRTGSYPDDLNALKYVGQWDRIALMSVRYCPSADRHSYFVEVTRGWVAKPKLDLPAEFWRGTGYRSELAPECH